MERKLHYLVVLAFLLKTEPGLTMFLILTAYACHKTFCMDVKVYLLFIFILRLRLIT